MSIRQGNNIIAGTPDASSVKIDNVSIAKNTSDEIQTIGVINQNDTTTAVKTWTGTKEQYEAIVTKNANTEYFCTDSRELYLGDVKIGSDSGLEVGDIGFAPLGIDEAQNKRRYLNGQVISQSQFVSFTNKVKSAIEFYPNLATSETNWQAEVTNSKLGQCGKFVIDDTLGTIRLPKVVNINGLQDLALMGSIKAESLPNITGTLNIRQYNEEISGAFYKIANEGGGGGGGTGTTVGFDASLLSSTYQDNAPVQQEAVQYPYFIQVATGVEESVDVTREIELNNPFFLGMSQYFESEPKNASWLISNGSFHSGATYVSFYEWLLKIYNGTETVDGVSVKASTDTYDDYDYVINTADTTFRLPIYNGNESLPSDRYIDLTLGASGTTYIAPANGYVNIQALLNAGTSLKILTDIMSVWDFNSDTIDRTHSLYLPVKKSETFAVKYEGVSSVAIFRFIYAQGNGSLYFYVGETIQDANVIAASQVLTTVADCVKKSSATDIETVVGWGMPDYSSIVSIVKDVVNQAPTDGVLICKVGDSSASNRPNFYLYFGYSSDVVDIEVARFNQSISDAWINSTINVLIPKGMFYQFVGNDGCYIDYCPLKGVN